MLAIFFLTRDPHFPRPAFSSMNSTPAEFEVAFSAVSRRRGDWVRFAKRSAASSHRFCFGGFRRRRPGPPPFSSMNSSQSDVCDGLGHPSPELSDRALTTIAEKEPCWLDNWQQVGCPQRPSRRLPPRQCRRTISKFCLVRSRVPQRRKNDPALSSFEIVLVISSKL